MRYIYYLVALFTLIIARLVFIDLIAVYDATPDLLLILTVWIALREGQFAGILAGFAIGFFYDFLSSDTLGTNALGKTMAGFVAGFFYVEGKELKALGGATLPLAVTITAIIHNLIYCFFYLKLSDSTFLQFFLRYGLIGAGYSMLIAIILMLINLVRNKY